ncbi:hypothetical protein RF11_01402 [Thelohanellus kitauei]|uniref:Uncharacterized protein n=1 Tax=Thelohanellus kitauei TaxID=669202 RepID=A0A0C2ND08_THEKT|nr:hypothetical protein RF11_01402 [Thelohanellus kitauei]
MDYFMIELDEQPTSSIETFELLAEGKKRTAHEKIAFLKLALPPTLMIMAFNLSPQRDQTSKMFECVTQIVSKIALILAFERFNASKESFKSYSSRPEQHLSFCSVVSSNTFTLLGKIRFVFEHECSWEEMTGLLSNHNDQGVHFIHVGVDFKRRILKKDLTYKD